MWRKRLRIAIAAFVIVFAAIVVMSLRRPAAVRQAAQPPPRTDPAAVVEARGGGIWNQMEQGRTRVSLRFGRQLTYADGRTKLDNGVHLTLPDRGGRTVEITGAEATVVRPPDRDMSNATFSGGVTLKTSDGIVVTAATAAYDDASGIVKVPGAVAFSHDRMHGTGVGATYDRGRDVLWILDQARIDVPPDATGAGRMHITAGAAGIARADHYMKFAPAAHLEANGRTIETDEATVFLTPDDKLVRRMELRGHAHITGTGAGPRSMQADDMDLSYGPDGRALQSATLMQHGAVELAGDAGAPGRRVSGQTIQIALAPDGTTVTSLKATDSVQVDLPGQGDVPTRRIRAATLVASGEPQAGLQDATFAGRVDYRETRPASKAVAAVNRTARSERLIVRTQPGFGNLQRADFHGNVHFTDGTDTTADAPVAIYDVDADRLDLRPSSEGDPGKPPQVVDTQFTVEARTVQMQLSAQKLTADTRVRSRIEPQRGSTPAPAAGNAAARGGGGKPIAPVAPVAAAPATMKMPSMLKQDEPVNVTSNRLAYDSAASRGVYTGNARLWQDDTVIQADTIELDNQTANLHARGNARSQMYLSETDPQTHAEKKTLSIGKANDLLYQDAKHLATYTGTPTALAHVTGPAGDVTGKRIDLYLAEQGGDLERAEADVSVTAVESTRHATGNHLTYVSATEQYVMVGTPVTVIDNTPPNCKKTVGATVTFYRTVDTMTAVGNGIYPQRSEPIACGTIRPQP
ncbi:MAG TPA: LptA/OstA family protein [Vicinamibacterales bacterium]|nr:LptA/OstA family protein [Vicinamibacterales bacterium]